ncbi:2-keto-4-pentenoate hydratase/2-oxohepta-3-ene-1,7-dioic acid hydratase (catechol pathway) [Actinomadura madurae]|uniref:2-keto-4-pentenoate hydratase/2-oxohepta-3-ene-1,7-dioic acid hydratase (Catechol pathway) n=1 Tax=Actinomadura madurae TaxID=1993 RepID=A0A1I5X7W4_9ACTN|nr:fumarylacetoacetate hydrolase family protein [Actinomadura madurae]SFQ28083.1 2-keto-4-pentenoate hydratase/2-oxohepta-3-ene-1,7-dioic acid hydratase (catechol pathway) [Actinomadura madurae]
MRLIGYKSDGVRHIGRLDGESVEPLATTADFYAKPDVALGQAGGTDRLPLAELDVVPFVPETARVFCVGINYLAHGDEAKRTGGIDLPEHPMIFGRWESTLVVDGAPVPVPPNEPGLDWEVELAAVIARPGFAVGAAGALDHVLGYTAFNDLSARRKQTETMQFTLGKNADSSGPIGPVLVTADELPDHRDLRLRTRVNGEVVQDASTGDMIHGLPEIIAYISDTVSLLPGDVITTGTPSGVGASMDPPRFLNDGDVVEVEVEHIGVLRTPIIDRRDLQVFH